MRLPSPKEHGWMKNMEDYACITGLPVPQDILKLTHCFYKKVSVWKHLILMSQITTQVYTTLCMQRVSQEDPDGPIPSDDDTDFKD